MAKKKTSQVATQGETTVLRKKPATYAEMMDLKGEREKELNDMMTRTGQYANARRILIEDGKYELAAIAMMSDTEVAISLQMDYACIGVTDTFGDVIILVPRDKLNEFASIVKYVSM